MASRKSSTNSAVQSQSPSKGNLTGPRRVVNDNIVTLYNTIQKWNDCYTIGAQTLHDLKNTTDADVFQASCEKIGTIVESMAQHETVMEDICKKLTSLSQLHSSSDSPVFKSWTFKDFVNSAARISNAYRTETKKKEKLAKVLKDYPPSTKEFDALCVAWVQLVDITTADEMDLQAMIYEADIRPPYGT